MSKQFISKYELIDLILKGISSEELNSKYNYSNITNMSDMFMNCSSLTSIPDLDTSKVQDMAGMFQNCSRLEHIDPYRFHLFDFGTGLSTLDSPVLRSKYPEIFYLNRFKMCLHFLNR